MTEDQIISDAVSALKAGKVILYPTDTIWGLGCDAFNEVSVDRIFSIKKRKKEKGFILLVDSVDMLIEYVQEIPPVLQSLIDVSDAPLTTVYGRVSGLPAHLLSSDGSVAIRVVQHKLTAAMIRGLGLPLISTSANTAGHLAPKDFNSIEQAIKDAADLIIPPVFDTSDHDTPSRMVVVGKGGRLEWIR